jgi:hypothetical protein
VVIAGVARRRHLFGVVALALLGASTAYSSVDCSGPGVQGVPAALEPASSLALSPSPSPSPSRTPSRTPAPSPALSLPPAGALYHGVYPGSTADPGSEDAIAPADLDAYERTVGHSVAWVYFSHEWSHGASFPLAAATWIRARGAVPFIRLMMRTDTDETSRGSAAERTYALSTIVSGAHDAALAAWGDAARDFATPIVAEWGTEMNGDWFPWNAAHNGRNAAATALFVSAWRRIVGIVRARGARNVTWVFHVNDDDSPKAPYNALESYYPGAQWVDWVGFSAYGAQSASDDCGEFVPAADSVVKRLRALAPDKPLFVLELGVDARARRCASSPAAWTEAALAAILGRRWPDVRGFSWWNERWENAGGAGWTDMRVQDSPDLAAALTKSLGKGVTMDRPVLHGAD